MINELDLLWVLSFIALGIYFIFGTKFSWNVEIDTCFNVEFVLLGRNFDFLGSYLVITARYLVITDGCCSLRGGYWWLLLVTWWLLLVTGGYQGWIQRFWKGEALYVGHHGWPAKKNLGFRWSKKAEMTLETISFWQNISVSIFKLSLFSSIKSYQFFKIY